MASERWPAHTEHSENQNGGALAPKLRWVLLSLGNLINTCEQQLNSTPSDRSEFLSWRLDEYERTLSTLISRFCETYGHELSQQKCPVHLTANCSPHKVFAIPFRKVLFPPRRWGRRYSESTQKKCPAESYGLQGRPRVVVTQRQLQTLHELCGFRWNDIAETLGVSDRTLRGRRHECGMRVEGKNCSSLSDAELDDIVRNIRAVTPEAGLLMVQGSLRKQRKNTYRKTDFYQLLSNLSITHPGNT